MIACAVILLGQLIAHHDLSLIHNSSLSFPIAIISLFCCLNLQIAVNLANDYFDHFSGVDDVHRKGPKRGLLTGKLSLNNLKISITVFLSMAIISGCYLVLVGGWVFFILGIISIIGVFLYSGGKYSFASRSLGEVAVFLFFGWLGVIGSYYLQVKHIPIGIFIPASELGLLIAAVMLVNNIRDLESDSKAGKFTLVYHLGLNYSRLLYGFLLLFPFVLLLINPYSPWINFFLLPINCGLYLLIYKRSDTVLNTQLAQTSLLVLLWSLGYFISFFITSS